MNVQKIKFNGLNFILPNGKVDSPIVTINEYKQGNISYAHLCPDGTIIQHGSQIGTIDDIEFGEFIDIDVDTYTFIDGLLSWI